MKRFAAAALLLLLASSARAAETVSVRVEWEYKDIPAGMSIYEPAKGEIPEVWSMGEGDSLKAIPVSSPIAGSTLRLKPGEEKTFVLVYRNETDKTVEFFAAPHHLHPAEAALGFKFDCLCVNHVYSARPGKYWWRIVQLTLDPEAGAGPLTVRHALVRYKKRAK